MQKVMKEDDGTRWIADTKTDVKLYYAPRNPPNTGSDYTRGIDLFAHKTRSHGERFYLRHWSMLEGEPGSIDTFRITSSRPVWFFMTVTICQKTVFPLYVSR